MATTSDLGQILGVSQSNCQIGYQLLNDTNNKGSLNSIQENMVDVTF